MTKDGDHTVEDEAPERAGALVTGLPAGGSLVQQAVVMDDWGPLPGTPSTPPSPDGADETEED